jgi:hypothetical protein
MKYDHPGGARLKGIQRGQFKRSPAQPPPKADIPCETHRHESRVLPFVPPVCSSRGRGRLYAAPRDRLPGALPQEQTPNKGHLASDLAEDRKAPSSAGRSTG